MSLELDSGPWRYAPFLSAFSLVVAGLTQIGARGEPRERDALELTEAALATFFLTRVIARERVGAVLREPFVETAPGEDPDNLKGEAKRPAGTGLRKSAGELVTCPRCLGPWAGAAVTFGSVFAPRHARIVTRVMALAGLNSLIHAGHAAACTIANRE